MQELEEPIETLLEKLENFLVALWIDLVKFYKY
jgi:hypothetical protein